MSISAGPSTLIYPVVDWNTPGATLGVRIRRVTDSVDVVARTTVGVVEDPAASGIYVQQAGITTPATAGSFYEVLWDDGTDFAAEDLTVTSSATTGTDLCALADLKAYLQKTDTTFDTVLSSLISRASAAIERYCSREFADKGILTRTFAVTGSLIDLMPYELRAATVVSLDPNGSPVVLTTDQFWTGRVSSLGTYLQLRTSRYTYLSNERSDSFGTGEISITGTWGAATTPPDVVQACVQTAGLWYRREVGARGSFNPDIEVDSFDLRPLSLPGSAIRLLAPYARTVYA